MKKTGTQINTDQHSLSQSPLSHRKKTGWLKTHTRRLPMQFHMTQKTLSHAHSPKLVRDTEKSRVQRLKRLPLSKVRGGSISANRKSWFFPFAVWSHPSPSAWTLGAPRCGAFERVHHLSFTSVALVPLQAGRVRVSVLSVCACPPSVWRVCG